MTFDAAFSSNSDEWFTPFDFFKKLDDEFHFTLDPCGSSLSPVSQYISNFYDINDDGLNKSWSGHVCFVNPPYSSISDWVSKINYEILYHNCRKCVLLIPARTDTKYFCESILPFADIRFVKGRLKFSSSGSAPFPSIVCIFSGNIKSSSELNSLLIK